MSNQINALKKVFGSLKQQSLSSTTTNSRSPAEKALLLEVDLKLPKEKLPVSLDEVNKKYSTGTVQDLIGSNYAVGSSSSNELVFRCPLGIFECVKEAWENHWNLRTTPEDWWFPVACRIAKAIDKAAKPRSSYHKEVRDLFVSHEGKEQIEITQNVSSIYGLDTESLFSSFSTEIETRIKVPTYATCMQNDFSTTTPAQKIASQINLMASMQEFFEYTCSMCGCGIKGLEMLGEQADWDKLVTKLRQVREELKPISWKISLYDSWFDHVEHVFTNLAKSYSDPSSDEVASFWADVLCNGYGTKYYGPSSMHQMTVPTYNGWLIRFLLDQDELQKEELSDSKTREKLSCLNSVPMTLKLTYVQPNITGESDLVAGIMGFCVHEPSETFNQVPSVKPHHMWAMKLPVNSPLRR